MYFIKKYFESIFIIPVFWSGSPEAEAGLSSVRQAVLRPEAAHQAGARGPQGDQRLVSVRGCYNIFPLPARVSHLQEEVHKPESAHQQDPQEAEGSPVRQVRQDILPREPAPAPSRGCTQLLTYGNSSQK